MPDINAEGNGSTIDVQSPFFSVVTTAGGSMTAISPSVTDVKISNMTGINLGVPVEGTLDPIPPQTSDQVFKGTADTVGAGVVVQVDAGPSGLVDYTTYSVGNEWELPTNPFEITDYIAAPSGGGIDPARVYLLNSAFHRLSNGNVLLTYTTGKAHVSDVDINAGRISTDEGRTFGAEFLISNNPTDIADNGGARACEGGVTETGRLILFDTVKSGVFDYQRTSYKYSDDNASTFSDQIFITYLFPHDVSGYIPFSPLIKTSRGWAQTYTHTDEAWLIHTTDNGLTWGDVSYIYNVDPAEGWNWQETYTCKIDDDRLVCLMRSGDQPEYYGWTRSEDAGRTWTTIVAEQHGTGTVTQPAPIYSILIGDQVYVSWGSRSPEFKLYTNRVAKEDFWENPARGWTDTTYLQDTNAIATTGINFGYPRMIPLLSGDKYTCLMTWYDQKSGGGTDDTDIRVKTFPVVVGP